MTFSTYRQGLSYARKIAKSSRYSVALLYDPLRGYYIVPSGLVLKEEERYVVEIISEDSK